MYVGDIVKMYADKVVGHHFCSSPVSLNYHEKTK